jgi:peptide/nickel transport system substrate-binding protein
VQLTDPVPLTDRLHPGLLDVHDRFPTRLHLQEEPSTNWVVLNTRLPPFNKLKARQAFNYAVDRDKWVRRNGEVFPTGEPTCQILPRNFPGYQPYCPYTVSPGSGKYRGPDLATARKLVEESGTKGIHVTVYGPAGPMWQVKKMFVKSVLTDIGYNADIKFADFAAPIHNAQVTFDGWLADYPLASNFYHGAHDCAAVAPDQGGTATACDPTLDATAKKAATLETSNPNEAVRLWTAIDHRLVDLSYVVPLSNDVTPTFVSKRVGNYQSSQFNGPVLSQMWIK